MVCVGLEQVHPKTMAELDASLPHIQQSPADNGRLELIVRRPVVDGREVLAEGKLDVALGLVGDTWRSRRSSRTADGSAHPDMQLNLMMTRAIEAIAGPIKRWPLAGDQLFVDFDLSQANVPPGTRLAIGGAMIEVTSQPHTGCDKFAARFGLDALKWVNTPAGRAAGLRGINARVVTPGTVCAGDVVRKV